MADYEFVLGVDGGGTKTLCALADKSGAVLGVGKSEGSNFQAVGIEGAKRTIREAIEQALKMANVEADKVVFATYGMAGADRDEDFEIFHQILDQVSPTTDYLLVNDTTIALRAGTRDGVGVAQVAGTGSNTIGFNSRGEQWKVGGLGELSGDVGSATYLAKRMIIAAFEAIDGRGPKTILVDMICKELNLKKLEDIIALFYVENFTPIEIDKFAPLLFKAANLGDKVAKRILAQTGRRMGYEITVCIKHLFKKDEPINVVLGGSVLQKGESPILVEELKKRVLKSYPKAKIIKLKYPPVLGAILFALDELYGKPTPKAVIKNVKRTLIDALKSKGLL